MLSTFGTGTPALGLNVWREVEEQYNINSTFSRPSPLSIIFCGSPMINFKIQGCQIYPKDRSRGRDSFELQRTGHSHQGGEVIGTREPSSMISELWPWSQPWPRPICHLVCLSTNSIVAEVYLIISCHYRESMIIFLVRQKYNTRLLIQQMNLSNCNE